MYTHIQSFHFDAPAEEVLAFLRQDGDNHQVTDGEYVFVYDLATEPAFHSVINVVSNVGLLRATRRERGDGESDPGTTPHPCAQLQLRLLQRRPGTCQGRLFIAVNDPGAVAASQGLTVDQAEAAIRGFIAGRWRQIIASWEAYKRGGAASDAPLRSRGGRPRYLDDDWAYEQVVALGRPRPEVYREWLGRIGERAGLLADPPHTFNQAIATRIKKPPEKSRMAVS